MSTTNQYTFLSWARKGLVNSISPVATGSTRASVELGVVVNGQTVSQTVEVLGPQDIIGMNADMVIRTEPRHWITDFEPNYLPFVEFYEEDFPWRYTPRLPNGTQLPPWLTLLALHPDEFEADDRSHPLPSIKILKNADLLFPPADQLWAWAHVHVNGAISQASELDTVVGQNPDRAYSRLFAARKLQPENPTICFWCPLTNWVDWPGWVSLPTTLRCLAKWLRRVNWRVRLFRTTTAGISTRASRAISNTC